MISQCVLVMKWSYQKYRQLHTIKSKIYAAFEQKLIDYHDDKKYGNRWQKDNKRFEPHELIYIKKPISVKFQHNRIMSSGLAELIEILAAENILNFFWFFIGTGTSKVSLSTIKPEAEVNRQDVRRVGNLNSDNQVLKHTATFPETLASDDYSEYGVMNKDAGGDPLFISRTDEDDRKLPHVQGETLMQASHQSIFRSR